MVAFLAFSWLLLWNRSWESKIDMFETLILSANENNESLSFNTICGSGDNGAYIHYSATNDTDNPVNKTNMLLLDSGGQYL